MDQKIDNSSENFLGKQISIDLLRSALVLHCAYLGESAHLLCST